MKQIFNLIIVDESGSMDVIRKQAFSGINETLKTIRTLAAGNENVKQRVSLITFDSEHMSLKYDNVNALRTHDLLWHEYQPGGCTPLYDAIGESVSRMNANVNLGDHVLVTVITDGEENCSSKWTLGMIRRLIEKLKRQNWTFTLIGTDNLDVESMARDFAIDEHLSFAENPEGTELMFAEERRSRIRYNDCVCCDAAMPAGSFFKKKKK